MDKRPRGRPAGSKDHVVSDKPYGMDEYAAARAFLKGIDPLTACRQYLLSEDVPKSAMTALGRVSKLLRTIATIGSSRKHGVDSDADMANQTAAKNVRAASEACEAQMKAYQLARKELLKKAAAELLEEATKHGLVPLPKKHGLILPEHFSSLEEFDRYYDKLKRPDEPLDTLELKSTYEEFLSDWYSTKGFYYRPDYSTSHNSYSERVRAAPGSAEEVENRFTKIPFDVAKSAERGIAVLEWTVQRKPHAADVLSAWMGGTSLAHLNKNDLFTLYSLCEFINRKGSGWWKKVAGLGPSRAARIQEWIATMGVQGITLPKDMFESIQKRRLKEIRQNEINRPALPRLIEYGLEPLAPYIDDSELNGSNGLFRRREANMLKAETDIDAILVALGKYKDKKGTVLVYAREICRFCLWSYSVHKMPISSLGVDDARQYREFLANIPPDWISTSTDVAPRNTSQWRPFRSKLDQVSQRKALTAINVILRQLMEGGYLTGNPMSGVLKHAELRKPKIDVSRSLSTQQWGFLLDVLRQEEANALEVNSHNTLQGKTALPSFRRLKALLHTLHSTGIRRDELFKARLSDFEKVVIDGESAFILTVTGKRSKSRQVLVQPNVMDLILQHLDDRALRFGDDRKHEAGRAKIPLISVLQDPVSTHQFASETDNEIVTSKRSMASASGALSPDGMQSVLKSFFAKCAAQADAHGIERDGFERATLHWLRHTFGHSMVDANVDIRVVQKALGHVNINTTAIYSKADLVQMVRGLRQGMDENDRLTGHTENVVGIPSTLE